MVGWKFTVFLRCFTLYLRAIFKYNPLGSLYLEGRFNGWFFAFTSLGGLQMEGLIFGILRYLAQILGQYFTGPGFCRPFFVRWTGVDFLHLGRPLGRNLGRDKRNPKGRLRGG